MLHRGCILPRFLVQMADKSIHSRDFFNSSKLALRTYICLLNHGYELYGNQLNLTSDDDVIFERHLVEEDVEHLKELAIKFHYFPTRTHLIPELLCRLVLLDVEIFRLVVGNGVESELFNDKVWEKVLTTFIKVITQENHSIETLNKFKKVGFHLTTNVIKIALCSTSPQILAWLKTQISGAELNRIASQLLHEIFGPEKTFAPSVATFVTSHFNMKRVIDSAIHTQKAFPHTRP